MGGAGRGVARADAGARAAQWARATQSLAQVAEHARAANVRLAVEPLNRFETDLVNTVEQGIRLCADVGADNVGLLLDTFHMNIEEKSLPAAITTAAPPSVVQAGTSPQIRKPSPMPQSSGVYSNGAIAETGASA